MKASLTTLVAIVTIGSLGLVAGSASACGGYKGGYGGYGHKSYGYKSYGYSYRPKVYVKPVYVTPVYDQCYHPHFSNCYVLPTDNWYTLSQRVYGNGSLGKHIASYNGLGYGGALPVGQQLNLPVVNGDGTLGASSAGPAPASFGQPGGLPGQGIAPQGQPGFAGGPQSEAFGAQPQLGQSQFGQPQLGQSQPGQQFGQQFAPQSPQQAQPQVPQMSAPNAMPSEQPAAEASQPATPAANIRVATPEESFPSVAMGSILMLDGEQLGDKPGLVRMRVGGLALPIKVLDWNENTAKIQLPQLDLAKAIGAEIEVVRADGSLASKSSINLTPAATRLALGN